MRGGKWVTTEDEILKNNSRIDNWIPSSKFTEILPHRTSQDICDRRNRLGLKRPNTNSKHVWTDDELKFLNDNYLQLSDEELAKKFDVSLNQIRTKKHNMRILKKKCIWTTEMEEFLKNNYLNFHNIELAKKLGTSILNIENKIKELKLLRPRSMKWRDEDDIFIKDNYLKLSDKELAQKLNRSLESIAGRRSRLKLSRIERHPRVKLKCMKCGKEFTAKYIDRERRFCSFKCSIYDDWTNKQIGMLIIETMKGTKKDDISNLIGKSKRECSEKLNNMGLTILRSCNKPIYSMFIK